MLTVSNVSKHYPTPRGPLTVLSDASLSLRPGEAAAITGPSGSGKISLLYVLGALEPPSSGTISLDGRNPFALSPREHRRCKRAMDALHAASALSDLNVPGWSVHPLKGNREGRHAMAVSGSWRLTFRWDGKDAHELDLEQYH